MSVVEAHQASEVEQNMAELQAVAPEVFEKYGKVKCAKTDPLTDGFPVDPNVKLIHFIRHGEGYHNVAQREWRAKKGWDGKTEPYTIDNDPKWKYVDAELNKVGRGQAKDLQQRTKELSPEALVVSPMRRATVTGLLAFEPHLARGEMPVIACELAHERAGRHTCDKRLSKAQLAKLYPAVDYSLVADEEDPYWGDGETRESNRDLALRAGALAQWLLDRPEQHIAVAMHSAILLALFNAAFECADAETRLWFGTGEMRSVLLRRVPKPSRISSRMCELPEFCQIL